MTWAVVAVTVAGVLPMSRRFASRGMRASVAWPLLLRATGRVSW